MITSVAQFSMKADQVDRALALVAAVEQEAAAAQPGTVVYLAHRVVDQDGVPTLGLLFYESYIDQAAVQVHLNSRSWQTLVTNWPLCFEGTTASIQLRPVERIAGFVRLPTG